MELVYYSISEVSEMLSESVSCIRFWTNSFPKRLSPRRTSKGNRLYTPEDLEMLKQIQYLVKTQGMTLKGAAKQLEGDAAKVAKKAKALETLKSIRAQLVEIKEEL